MFSDDSYKDGYDRGYEDGYHKASEEEYQEAYDTGYEKASEEEYNDAYYAILALTFIFTLLYVWLANAYFEPLERKIIAEFER